MTNDQKTRLLDAAKAAVSSEKTTQCPAELTVSQWAVESGWGEHQPQFNCFGIKQRAGRERQLLSTTEWFTPVELQTFLTKAAGRTAEAIVDANGQPQTDGPRTHYRVQDWFAAYDSLDDCFEDHAALIVHGAPYSAAWAQYRENRDSSELIKGIASRYATAPGYADRLLEIVQQQDVQDALAQARA